MNSTLENKELTKFITSDQGVHGKIQSDLNPRKRVKNIRKNQKTFVIKPDSSTADKVVWGHKVSFGNENAFQTRLEEGHNWVWEKIYG